VDIETFSVCLQCNGQLELLVDREPGAGITIRALTTKEDMRRLEARTVDAVYSAIGDGQTCAACEEMDGKVTVDMVEANSWAPNTKCTAREGCRCMVVFQMVSLDASEVRAFLEYAVENRRHASALSIDQYRRVSQAREDELSRHLYDAAEQMHKANHCEKTDLTSAAALYRDAIVRFLDSTENPLDREAVRRNLLFIFDRLSLVLKRNGLPKEALEEIESAVSLGLLDCRDYGIKGHCEALRKRRNSLQRAVAKASHDRS
jgi:hypothetical protein